MKAVAGYQTKKNITVVIDLLPRNLRMYVIFSLLRYSAQRAANQQGDDTYSLPAGSGGIKNLSV